jgi:hypothetical protein
MYKMNAKNNERQDLADDKALSMFLEDCTYVDAQQLQGSTDWIVLTTTSTTPLTAPCRATCNFIKLNLDVPLSSRRNTSTI